MHLYGMLLYFKPNFATNINLLQIGDVISISIRRTDLLKDAYTELNCLRSQLKKMIKVEFISKEGIPEAGIDGGGLFRELLTEYVIS